jgi:hypothetical protein
MFEILGAYMVVISEPEYLIWDIRCLYGGDIKAGIFEILGAYMAVITELEYLRY